MDSCEVVKHKMERDSRFVILDFFRECVRQPSKPAHRHAHGQVLAFGKTG
jgi:hypothetical protein